mmetsp:Transcript_8288/g.17977  ORF Transcript_8288/g.17977 Transcript_8288/m.17977 type:complete len:83 (+) Transcript_8288:161-409(+)
MILVADIRDIDTTFASLLLYLENIILHFLDLPSPDCMSSGMSQIMMAPSSPTLTTVRWSGEMRSAFTRPLCPTPVATSTPSS